MSRVTKLVIVGALAAAGVLLWFLFRPELERRPRARAEVEVFGVGGVPRSLLVTAEHVWVGSGDRTLMRLDRDTGDVEETFDLQFVPGDIVAAGDEIFVGAIEGDRILRFPEDGRPGQEGVQVGTTPQSLAVGGGWLWVAAFDDGFVQGIDLIAEDTRKEVLRSDETFPSGLTWFDSSLWVSDVVGDVVRRLDSEGNIMDSIAVGDGPTSIVGGEGSVWVAEYNERSVSRIDPDEGTSQSILVGGRPGGIATGGGYVWVTRGATDDLVRIDVSSGRWTGEVFEVGDAPQGVAVDGSFIWVANSGNGTVARVSVTD